MSLLSRAIAFLQAASVRRHNNRYAKFEATHVLLSSKPNPATTITNPRLPLREWRYVGHEHGKKYTGAHVRQMRAEGKR